MAILKFPFNTDVGSLVWEESDQKFDLDSLKDFNPILYYMGCNIFCNWDEEGLYFCLRKTLTKIDPLIYRDLLFNFVILFYKITINLPDPIYAKKFLGDFYIPLDKRNVVFDQKMIFHNNYLYLVLSNNCMINGKGYLDEFLGWTINNYNDGETVLPVLSEALINMYTLKIEIDVAEGLPLNDPYTDYVFEDLDLADQNDTTVEVQLSPEDNPENDFPF